MNEIIEHIPILTTLIALYFFVVLLKHYRAKPSAKYLLWWTIGVGTYGLGTLLESVHTLFGWNDMVTRLWYVAGALLGGWPLAQGTVYLLVRRRIADILTLAFLFIILVGSICVFATPISIPAEFDGRLTGAVFEWQWVRAFSPLINLYAFIFLFGGAIYSAYKYYKLGPDHPRFLGNVFISIGALLPGIGGSFTRMGYVEVLFVTELVGLFFILAGYLVIRNDRQISVHTVQLAS